MSHDRLEEEPGGLDLPLDDAAGPARPLEREAATWLVRAALERAALEDAIGPARRRRVLVRVAVAGLILGLALGATALARRLGRGARRAAATGAPSEEAVTPARSAAASATPSASMAATPPGSAATSAPASAATMAPRATQPASPAGMAQPATATPLNAAAPADATTATRPAAPLPSPAATGVRHLPPPHDLLAAANALRAAQRWSAAERAYQRVRHDFPRSPEAYAATVAAASLHLDHLDDAAGALALYRVAALGHTGAALAEETDWGVAACQRALGDREAEARALSRFLAAHPDSLLRERAAARLAGLHAR